MKARGRLFGAAILLSFLLAGLAAWLLRAPSLPPDAHSVYVWNYDWKPAVSNAVQNAAAGGMQAFYVVCGELGGRGRVRPDGLALAAARRPVVPVVRVLTDRAKLLESDPTGLAGELTSMIRSSVDELAAGGTRVEEVQVDLDCPERLLGPYARFLEGLRPNLQGLRLSATVLPCHAARREIQALARVCDELVLQVHGTAFPAAVGEEGRLIDEAESRRAIRRMSALGTPFRVALPDYALAMVFDHATGRRKGLRFAHDTGTNPHELIRTLAPDPAVVHAVQCRAAAAPGCRGVIWFRLPVPGDALAWDLETLLHLTRGQVPEATRTARLVDTADGTRELRVRNHCELHARRVEIHLRWGEEEGEFGLLEGETAALPGILPETVLVNLPVPGEEAAVAWFRFDGPDPKIRMEDAPAP